MKNRELALVILFMLTTFTQSCEVFLSDEKMLERKLEGRWEIVAPRSSGYLNVSSHEWVKSSNFSSHGVLCPPQGVYPVEFKSKLTCYIQYLSKDEIKLSDCIEERFKNCLEEESVNTIPNPQVYQVTFSESDGYENLTIGYSHYRRKN